MKRKAWLVLVCGVLVLAAGVALGAGPTAAFNFTPASPIAGQAVEFTDTSTGNPTTWSWTFGDGATSVLQNPVHAYSTAGTFTVTLTAGNAGGSNSANQNLTVRTNIPAFTMAQTISDGAQRTTLAFSGLAIMTGNLEAQSFFPPGKVADYTGFQYLRDNDPDNMGHNTSFLTRVANNVIYVLNDDQFAQLKTLAVSQRDQINLYGYKRFPLMKAYRRLLDGDVPAGSPGLNLNAVKQASRELYLIDGQISFDRALLYANVLNSMDSAQKAYLDSMKGKGWKSWPDITNAQIDSKMKGLPQGTAVAVMTYAGDLFSWYAGSVDADVYFCPERHGTYYGGFYIKDAPAIGHEGYSIDEQLTATAGSALCDSSKGYVTQAQATVMSSLVATQKNNLYAGASNIVATRTQIDTLLRSLLISTASGDTVKAQVLTLSGAYGDLDGENNYNYATVFAQVYKTLTNAQKTALMDLRTSIMSGTYADGTPFDYTVCTTPFLYSSPITDQSVLTPYIANTDYLFLEGTTTTTTLSPPTTTSTTTTSTTTLPPATTTSTTTTHATTTTTHATTTTSASSTTSTTVTTSTSSTTTTTIPGRIAVLYPSDSGITLERGKTYITQWTTVGLPAKTKVKVELVNGGSETWVLSADTTNLWIRWTVGKSIKGADMYPDGDDYRIRVSALNGSDSDESDSDFAIGSVSSLTVSGPATVTGGSAPVQYSCTAHYDFGDDRAVTNEVKWKLLVPSSKPIVAWQNSSAGRMRADGMLITKEATSDQLCRILATYDKGTAAVAGWQDVTIGSAAP